MDGFLVRAPTGESPAISEPSLSNPELSQPQSGPNDEMKADLMKSRRFSTSPQLPTLTRMSGFGDDFFSSSRSDSSKNKVGDTNVPSINTAKQPSYTHRDASPDQHIVPTADKKLNPTEEGVMESDQPVSNSSRPQLVDALASADTNVSAPLERPMSLEDPAAGGTTRQSNIQDTNGSRVVGSDVEPNNKLLIEEIASLPSSIDTSKHIDVADEPGELNTAAGQHPTSIAPGTQAMGGHYPTAQSLPPLNMDNSIAQSPALLMAADKEQKTHTPSMTNPMAATVIADFSPTAPLNTSRAQAVKPDFDSPLTNQRKSTISTIETASPEKESDKLREEIIKSLSPAPISPGLGGLPDPNTGPDPGDLARESTYLAGVYDDYLSLSEEKSLQEVSQAAKKSAVMTPNQSTNSETKSAPEPQGSSVSQPVPAGPIQNPASESMTRLRRFSWQHDPEEVTMSPDEFKPTVSLLQQEESVHGQSGTDTVSNNKPRAASPVSDSLQAETGATGTISHQVSQVSSRAPEESLATFEPPSPISFVATRAPKPASDELNMARLSLADEKEKVLIGDVQSTTSSTSEQHPALTTAPELVDDGPSSPQHRFARF
ncbi:hypothetical protein O1611_g10594 [Lasiodiplodia mahajangana]|uniref:Uncharacterized protein n=1 Tax=Lasiodiplodia mahajangana TaxID=1108764 RepID=A0ACC2IWC2_9PEZI|nr:hypothetical protein O1611_g10594 [Lasiodiplodia mahajangana]